MTTSAPVLTPLQAVRHGAYRAAARNRGYDRYVDDPIGFVRDVLHESPWSKQREVAESVRDNRHTGVRSSHATGKSFIASRLAAWWLSAHPPGSAFVLTSAPSFPQVRAILWREINRAHKRGKLRGSTNQTEWWIDGEIVAMGRKPADYDEDAFQGIHARYVLVILDEACGIPEQLWTAAETVTTNKDCRVLAIGNPDTPLSAFKRRLDSPIWNTIHIDGLESPNFTGEIISEDPEVDAAIKAQLIDHTWVEERREEWGEDSPLFESKVRGNFPKTVLGAVYQDLSPSQQHYGSLPPFKLIKAGVDIGGPNDADHKTTAVIGGLVGRAAKHEDQTVAEGTLIRFAHFEHAGPRVHEELVSWMKHWEAKLGRRLQWTIDKSQILGIKMLQKDFRDNPDNPQFILPTSGVGGSVAAGIDLVRARMAQGSSRFTEELLSKPLFPDGRPMNGESWYKRMSEYRLILETDPNKPPKLIPLKRGDDTPDADRYLHEAIDGLPTHTGPVIHKRTLSGKRRGRKAA